MTCEIPDPTWNEETPWRTIADLEEPILVACALVISREEANAMTIDQLKQREHIQSLARSELSIRSQIDNHRTKRALICPDAVS